MAKTLAKAVAGDVYSPLGPGITDIVSGLMSRAEA